MTEALSVILCDEPVLTFRLCWQAYPVIFWRMVNRSRVDKLQCLSLLYAAHPAYSVRLFILRTRILSNLCHMARLSSIGTVLGFVISYRTTSSFERYNEGRRLWSQIVLASRTYARTVWFHVPGQCNLLGQLTNFIHRVPYQRQNLETLWIRMKIRLESSLRKRPQLIYWKPLPLRSNITSVARTGYSTKTCTTLSSFCHHMRYLMACPLPSISVTLRASDPLPLI